MKNDGGLHVGDMVFTRESGYEDEWWFNWPGIVRKVTQVGTVHVEFMGFDQAAKRTISLPVRLLAPLVDAGISQRVARISRQLRTGDAHPRLASDVQRNQVPSPDLPEDDDMDDLLN